MIPQFENLTADEIQTLIDAPAYITVLVAGADGNIEDEEHDWAVDLAEIRGYAHKKEALNTYYDHVKVGFSEKIHSLTAFLPKDLAARQAAISEYLAKLNAILPKIDPRFANKLYLGYLSFAEHIAKSSGGFLRFGSISAEERAVMGLKMIVPIEAPEGEDEAAQEEETEN